MGGLPSAADRSLTGPDWAGFFVLPPRSRDPRPSAEIQEHMHGP